MNRTRVLGIAVMVLLVSTMVLAVRTFQLSRRLEHAEAYVQSGSLSFTIVCGGVATAVREGGLTPWIQGLANRCMGSVTLEEAEAMDNERRARNYKALADRLRDRVNRRQLPFHGFSLDRTLMPEGY